MTELRVGSTFSGVTKKGRIIPLAKVVEITAPMHTDFPFPWVCVWYDENGKHHESFVREEFREFNVVSI